MNLKHLYIAFGSLVVIIVAIVIFREEKSSTPSESKTSTISKNHPVQQEKKTNLTPVVESESPATETKAETPIQESKTANSEPDINDLEQYAMKKAEPVEEYQPPVSQPPGELEAQSLNSKKTIPEFMFYRTKYFNIQYPTSEWVYSAGKDMTIPDYIVLPKRFPLVVGQLKSIKDPQTSIIIYVAEADMMSDFATLDDQNIDEYVRYLFYNAEVGNIKIEKINKQKFAAAQIGATNTQFGDYVIVSKNTLLYVLVTVGQEQLLNTFFRNNVLSLIYS